MFFDHSRVVKWAGGWGGGGVCECSLITLKL